MDMDINLENLSRDELEEEFRHMARKCKQLCDASEEDAQRIYVLKRNLETALAAQTYLAQDLEQLTANSQQNSVDTKLQTEHEELRRKYHELSAEFSTLQDSYNTLSAENTKLQSSLQSLNDEKEKSSAIDSQASNEMLVGRLNVLEQENMELLHKLDEQLADKMQHTMALADREKKINLMKDEVACLEENMRYKREELEEKTRMLESAQEQLCEANAKINMLMSAPDNKDRKGNSLFAEVDDQRQAMKQLLAAQRKSFQEMKKIYNESQYEIRRLKRENAAMHTELQSCSLIFCSADRTYQEKLNIRIKHLLEQNEALELKLKLMQQHMTDLANEKGEFWMDSMLKFCKKETEDLKNQLHSLLIKNASMEEQLRNVQQDMVRWRFEALKSRCLLINRENLLSEHKIEFKPQKDVEYKVTEQQQNMAHPRIVPAKTWNLNSLISSNSSTDEDSTKSEINSCSEQSTKAKQLSNLNPKTECLNENLECNKENNAPTMFELDLNFETTKSEAPVHKILPHISSQTENDTGYDANKQIGEKIAEAKLNLPSILSTNREFNNFNAEKNVTFAANEATLYEAMTTHDSAVNAKENEPKEESMKCERFTTSHSNTNRGKSVIVRHFVVGSKPK